MKGFPTSFRALIPELEGGSAQVDAIDEELQGFGVEFDSALGGLAAADFFESFRGDLCAPFASSLSLLAGGFKEAQPRRSQTLSE